MTSSVTEAVVSASTSFTYEFRSTTLGVAVVLTLLLLMFAREMFHAHGTPQAGRRSRALDVAVWPLFLTFGLIVSVRLLELI